MNQSESLAILKSGRNVFLTGAAGAGKTHVLNLYIGYLKERKVPVAVTASTGIAATHMNGMTIHAWSGIGIKDTITSGDLRNMQTKKYLIKNLKKAQVLIIDEISMLHKKQFEMVDKVLRSFREDNTVFGGVQLVLSGDFFQLPPIGSQGEFNKDKFAFMSQAWREANLAVCYVTEQFRQEDNSLNDILNEIRCDQVSPHSIKKLEDAKMQILNPQKKPTKMFTHNCDVEKINKRHLNELSGKSKRFKAAVKGNKKLVETLKKSVLTDEELEVKSGAKVMFVKNNYEKGYVNGTLGHITGFSDDGFPIVKTFSGKYIYVEPEEWSVKNDTGKNLASFIQLPLRLAWAITVHKSQGMTLDSAEIDLGKTFEKGQGYVALSRLKTLQGLQLKEMNSVALQVDPLAGKADKRFQELSAEVEECIPGKKEIDKLALRFIKKCGGITDPGEIEKFSKKVKEKKNPKKSTYLISKQHIDNGLTLNEIARERGLTRGTIIGHLAKIREKYPETDISTFKPADALMNILQDTYDKLIAENNRENFHQNGLISMKALFDAMGGKVSYEDIKLGMAFLVK